MNQIAEIFAFIVVWLVGVWLGRRWTEDSIIIMLAFEEVFPYVDRENLSSYEKGWRDSLFNIKTKIKGAVKHGRNS